MMYTACYVGTGFTATNRVQLDGLGQEVEVGEHIPEPTWKTGRSPELGVEMLNGSVCSYPISCIKIALACIIYRYHQ